MEDLVSLGEMYNPKKTTKSAIIEVLSLDWPLSAKDIYSKVKKLGLSLTYQAVYKTIQELTGKKIIINEKSKYKLNTEWIKNIKQLSYNLEKSYFKQITAKEKENYSLKVNCLWDLYMFILDSFTEDWFDVGEKSVCIHSEHVWIPPVGTEREWSLISEFANKHQMYVLVRTNTALDNMLKGSWEDIGLKYKLGMETESSKFMMDLFIVGDHLIQIYYPHDCVKQENFIFQNTKSINDLKMETILNFFYKKYDEGINIIINKNKTVAQQLREQTERAFK